MICIFPNSLWVFVEMAGMNRIHLTVRGTPCTANEGRTINKAFYWHWYNLLQQRSIHKCKTYLGCGVSIADRLSPDLVEGVWAFCRALQQVSTVKIWLHNIAFKRTTLKRLTSTYQAVAMLRCIFLLAATLIILVEGESFFIFTHSNLFCQDSPERRKEKVNL